VSHVPRANVVTWWWPRKTRPNGVNHVSFDNNPMGYYRNFTSFASGQCPLRRKWILHDDRAIFR